MDTNSSYAPPNDLREGGVCGMHMTGNQALVDRKIQINEDLDTRYTEIRCLEPLITSEIEKMADSLGTKMSGLEYSIKTGSSTEGKLQRMLANNPGQRITGQTLMQNLESMKDIIRYTEICKHDDIFSIAGRLLTIWKNRAMFLAD